MKKELFEYNIDLSEQDNSCKSEIKELPSNIATVDEGEKVGNVYTKEQIDQLLQEILLKCKCQKERIFTKTFSKTFN